MNISTLTEQHPSLDLMREIVANLPTPNYPANFQPTYSNHESLARAMLQVHTARPVTNPRQIDALRTELSDEDRPIVITGNCAEPVDSSLADGLRAERVIDAIRLVGLSAILNAIVIHRGRGQNTKPRSNEFETLENGLVVPSYMGDMVNGREVSDREPSVLRMVAAALQASALEQELQKRLGKHVPAAHEALLLPYELASLHTDPDTGKQYLPSADLLWIGLRTNSPDSEHVELLSGVENPVGVKLGPETTADHIARLSAKLNPSGLTGKLIHMLRIGPDNVRDMERVITAIRDYSPNSRVMYDIHGTKDRVVTDILREISVLAQACGDGGLRLAGVHLETITNNARKECPDACVSEQTQPGNVDKQLNPNQTLRVLNHAAQFVNT